MVPGAFNGMVGRIAADNGFQALYVSGAAVTASSGVPDIGLITFDGFCKIIKEVSMSSGLPVLADADTGFGEGEMCARTVWEYFQSGASGLHIEDQIFPKRCGHLDGKSLVSQQDFVRKVQIAAETSLKCSNGQFIICARTDARSVEGLDSVITRSKAYIDAGADMIFPEGLGSAEEFQQVAQALKGYGPKGGPFLLANMTEYGKTPYIHIDDFKKWGYNCVIYPVSTLRVAMKAVDDFFKQLNNDGTQQKSLNNMQTRKELYETLGYTPGKEWIYPNMSQNKKIELHIQKK
ncbi:methylisocitrate lyase, putative [Ichthyophthirius multifiliis]|uniref:Methylisocitrate lyase, putative n=1 Tax=Ichthyophthirius multifiliis TaxID=5932 RepID=G0QMT4_ICHMU|nr:methylisocitrate lyase, putative [Ichthyophthirius multifiliis]EGR33487.1 methylisocitrate lyase, putative [Ichthyophthirius multifiliis]|eukprot:XP_004037473.1 methylisocitrate lyase, putative [Ichthyophthirius multifiliis]